jgi:hypothetical protein
MQVLCNGPEGFTQPNEHIEADGPTVFAHACKMGLEGIVSKRKDQPTAAGALPTGSNPRTRLAQR